MSKNKYFTKSKWLLSAFLIAVLSLFFVNTGHTETGEELFTKYCTACHKLTNEKAVGPGLAGLQDRRSEEWLLKWIKDSKALIDSGDEEAIALFAEYNSMPMMAFTQLSDDDIKGILSYISEQATVVQTAASGDTAQSEEGLLSSTQRKLVFWFFIFILIIGLYLYKLSRKVDDFKVQNAFFGSPHAIKNFAGIFVLFLAITGVVIYGLTLGLKNNIGSINNIFFAVFPYVALAIFLIGSIYRYTEKGYKVSSLSTQFLEGRKLFWGSQPFHWGLLVLFFGHLIAFLFPSAIIAWNGSPVRLLILEITSFVFGLLALIGLVLLIVRRLSSRSILVVTNKMDMVVYTILLTQIVSGLGVAFFLRWGSSWFASVMTPYLSSVFSFNPDITAVSAAPLWVQIHIISAFLIIAIIPFTRFMHFLVAPVDYIWRRYQLVIWNWNSKGIRQSKKHTYGKEPRNH